MLKRMISARIHHNGDLVSNMKALEMEALEISIAKENL